MSGNVHVEWKDLPKVVQDECLKIARRKRPAASVRVARLLSNDASGRYVITTGGPGRDYSRKWVVVIRADGGVMRKASGYYDSYLNMTPDERSVYHGGDIHIPPDGMVMEYDNMHRPYVIIHAGPESELGKAVHVLASATDNALDEIEAAVLGYYTGLNSKGRRDALHRYGIPRWLINGYTTLLAARGIVKVSKNGAVTTWARARNVQSANKPRWSWYKFSSVPELRKRIISDATERLGKEGLL